MPYSLTEYAGDLLGLAFSILVIALYHGYLRLRLVRDPNYTIQAVNRAARRAWVDNIMSQESAAILGVQTLRNSTMAATFLASTAVLLIIGTLTLSGQADKLADSWHMLNAVGSLHPGLWVAKLLCLVVDFFIAFFSFSMALRLFNHVGYQVTIPARLRPAAITPEKVAIHLNRAGSYYSIGMRAYYFSVPLVFWLFGPHLMVMAALILIAVLYHIDRAPKGA
ncbi:MAG: DUF599 domain-containing protein [Gammaproteobacteria bacterium]